MIDRKTGKKIKGRFSSLKMAEIAGVDNPAQAHARFVIMKRAGEPGVAEQIAKSVYGLVEQAASGPQTFAQLVEAAEQREKEWDAYRELSSLFDALSESLRSIAGADGFGTPAKIALIRQSVDDFMNAVAAKMPDVEQQLEKLLRGDEAQAKFSKAGETGDHHHEKGDPDMDLKEALAEIEKLKGQAGEQTTKAAAAETKAAELAKRAETAEAKIVEVTKAKEAAEKDEVIKVGETEVRKSVVGDATFSAFRSQQDDIRKANDARELVEFQKTAEGPEFGQLPGEPVIKARVLKAAAGMPEDERKALDVMLKGGNAALNDIMKAKGRDGDGGQRFTKAEDKLNAAVKKYQDDNKIVSHAKAYDDFLQSPDGAKLYGEMQEDERKAQRHAA